MCLQNLLKIITNINNYYCWQHRLHVGLQERMKTNSIQILTIGLISSTLQYGCHAFTTISPRKIHSTKLLEATRGSKCDNNEESLTSSRRSFFEQFVTSSLLIGGGLVLPQNESALAASATTEPTIWKSGKEPIVPGKKPKDKNDVSGTRKDPDFLRSISTCKVCIKVASLSFFCLLVFCDSIFYIVFKRSSHPCHPFDLDATNFF